MFEYFNKRSNIEYVEMPSEIKNNYQYFTQADISKLRNAGYKKEFTDIKTAVKDYCAYLEKKAYI
jgi:ADP-L-glycero-D-manno-heptose 6-epimerase